MKKIKKICAIMLIMISLVSAPALTAFADTNKNTNTTNDNAADLDKDGLIKLFILSWYFDYESYCYLLDYISYDAHEKVGKSGKVPRPATQE